MGFVRTAVSASGTGLWCPGPRVQRCAEEYQHVIHWIGPRRTLLRGEQLASHLLAVAPIPHDPDAPRGVRPACAQAILWFGARGLWALRGPADYTLHKEMMMDAVMWSSSNGAYRGAAWLLWQGCKLRLPAGGRRAEGGQWGRQQATLEVMSDEAHAIMVRGSGMAMFCFMFLFKLAVCVHTQRLGQPHNAAHLAVLTVAIFYILLF